jgi:hypothetical protein
MQRAIALADSDGSHNTAMATLLCPSNEFIIIFFILLLKSTSEGAGELAAYGYCWVAVPKFFIGL